MAHTVKLIPTGFSFIDEHWGGIYEGGSYIVVGSKKSGKSLFALNFIKESVQRGKCLYFSNLRPNDLFINASSIELDLKKKVNDELVTLVRVLPVPHNVKENDIDDYLAEYLNDIFNLVKKYNPKFLIFDEITQFINYQNVKYFQKKFINILEAFEKFGLTSLFLINEPHDEKSNLILQTLDNYSTGIIKFTNTEKPEIAEINYGEVHIKPNVGHLQGEFRGEYLITPEKGLIIKPVFEDILEDKSSESTERIKVYHADETSISSTSVAEVEEKIAHSDKKEEFSFSNIYEYNDFLLILNTHIALYKSTSQAYNLICFQIDESTDFNGEITYEQLKNVVISATDRKDKICFIQNKIFILVVRSTKNAVDNLTERVYKLLKNSKENFTIDLISRIKALVLESETDMENSETLMKYILSPENKSQLKFYPLNNYLS